MLILLDIEKLMTGADTRPSAMTRRRFAHWTARWSSSFRCPIYSGNRCGRQEGHHR
jgi:hypothetical protein